MNKLSRKVIGIVTVSVLIGGLIISMSISLLLDTYPPLLTNINNYDEYVDEVYNAETFMPSFESLPDYESIEVYYDNRSSKSISLSITYDEIDYKDAKMAILEQYTALEEESLVRDGVYLIQSTKFEYGSYTVLVIDNENFDYPSNFGMIGYSDEHNSITFLFFYDRSRGQISYDMADFVDENFKFPQE